MRRIALALLCAALLALAAQGARAGVPGDTLSPELRRALESAPAGGRVPVIVTLRVQAAPQLTGGRRERRRALLRELRDTADRSQRRLLGLLAARQREGRSSTATPLWVVDAVAVSAEPGVVAELAADPDVAQVTLDSTLAAPARPAGSPAASPNGGGVEPNIAQIGAPAVWALGDTGQGVVVASMDTGVDASHPDLAPRYRGGSNSWYDPYGQHAAPVDLNGHGTWTVGLMVGGSAGGTAVGVAPGARWIAVKIYNDAGTATTSAIHQGFQWLLDPDGSAATDDAPDIVNASWALGSAGACDLTFAPDLQALVAAGIAPVFAAGNYGPGASTSVSPPNNPGAFPVGAVDSADTIASTSSRGPTSCGRPQPATYPSVVAPGVDVLTTDLFRGYFSVTGTSFAAPHVAGAMALLLSAYPTLTVDQLESALASTAVDLGPAGADSAYGAGRIDVHAAYAALAGGTPTATSTSTPTPTSATTSSPTPTPTATSTPTDTPASTPTGTPPPATGAWLPFVVR